MEMNLSVHTGSQGVAAALNGLGGFGRQNIARMPAGPRKTRAYEAARLFADVLAGRVDPYWLRTAIQPPDDNHVNMLSENGYPGLYPKNVTTTLRETMSRTDYQALFADVLDILYYGFFSAFPDLQRSGLPDSGSGRYPLRQAVHARRPGITRGIRRPRGARRSQQALSGPVPQDGSTFPTTNTAAIEYQPALMQTKASINWSAMLNDNLGIFKDVPRRIVISINRGITIFIHSLYAGNGVLNTNLFQAGYKNIILIANGAGSDNPPLGAQGIMDATKILAGQRDSSGQPIMMGGRSRQDRLRFCQRGSGEEPAERGSQSDMRRRWFAEFAGIPATVDRNERLVQSEHGLDS